MPLTAKGKKLLRSLTLQYGPDKGREVLYAGIHSGRFKGCHAGKKK